MSEIELGTNYQIHKTLMAKSPGYSEEQLADKMTTVGQWFSFRKEKQYFTLMCREKYDFTVFNFINHNYTKAVQELQEVLESRGKILAIDYVHDGDYYECWIKDDVSEEAFVYLLFDYSQGVIEV